MTAMFGRNAKADLTTKISLRPQGSQVVLLAFVLVSSICIFVGFHFLWSERSSWPIPLVTGAIIALATLFAWFHARRDIDLRDAPPTEITTPAGMHVSTDARSLASPALLQGLTNVLQILSHREPLPEPDGLVNEDGVPVQGSKAEAVSIVRAANEGIREHMGEFATMFAPQDRAEAIQQPVLNQEGDNSLIEANAPASPDPQQRP